MLAPPAQWNLFCSYSIGVKFFQENKRSLPRETYLSFLFNWGGFNWGAISYELNKENHGKNI